MSFRNLIVLASVLLVAVGVFAGPALAGGHDWEHVPPHGHVMVQGFEVEVFEGPGGVPWWRVTFRKCVELANGDVLPTPAHHHSVHRGTAGHMLFTKAGNIVAPLAPLTPWESCDDFVSGMEFPAPSEE